jgi:hypothetical protein
MDVAGNNESRQMTDYPPSTPRYKLCALGGACSGAVVEHQEPASNTRTDGKLAYDLLFQHLKEPHTMFGLMWHPSFVVRSGGFIGMKLTCEDQFGKRSYK